VKDVGGRGGPIERGHGAGDFPQLPGVEDKEDRRDQAKRRGGMIPAEMLAEVEGDEDAEDHEGDDLLDHFELNGAEAAGADAVGRHLEAVLKKCNAPTDQNDLPQRLLAESQVAIPGEGHEDVGEYK